MTIAASAYRNAPGSVDQQVEQHLPLVRHVVSRLLMRLPPHYESDELIQWGVCGLLHAVRSFDPQRGVTFATFAYQRIQGAILDELRKIDTRSRTERRRATQIAEAARDIEARVGRPAHSDEIAEATALTVAQVEGILQKSGGNPTSLADQPGDEDPSYGVESLASRLRTGPDDDPAAQAMFAERKELLAEALASLPDRERLVIQLYYHKELRVKEIAAVLGVSDGRVSQLHTKALKTMADLIARREGGRTA